MPNCLTFGIDFITNGPEKKPPSANLDAAQNESNSDLDPEKLRKTMNVRCKLTLDTQ